MHLFGFCHTDYGTCSCCTSWSYDDFWFEITLMWIYFIVDHMGWWFFVAVCIQCVVRMYDALAWFKMCYFYWNMEKIVADFLQQEKYIKYALKKWQHVFLASDYITIWYFNCCQLVTYGAHGSHFDYIGSCTIWDNWFFQTSSNICRVVFRDRIVS